MLLTPSRQQSIMNVAPGLEPGSTSLIPIDPHSTPIKTLPMPLVPPSTPSQSTPGPYTAQLTFLQTELTRIQYEEETRRKSYQEARVKLQTVWDKLVAVKTQIRRAESEIDEAKLESLAIEAECSLLTGSAAASTTAETSLTGSGSSSARYTSDDTDSLTLSSASRAVDLRVLREKMRLRDALHEKVALKEEVVLGLQRRVSELSQQLRESSYARERDTATDTAILSPDSLSLSQLTKSMEVRSALLACTREVHDEEIALGRLKEDLERVEREVSVTLDSQSQGLESSNNRGSNMSSNVTSNMFQSPSRIVSPPPVVSEVDGSMLDLVSQGRPFSQDLATALISYSTTSSRDRVIQTSTPSRGSDSHSVPPSTPLASAVYVEYSLDEILAEDYQIVRINGELPQLYMQRLTKRLCTLQYLETQVTTEFSEVLKVVQRYRDIVKDIELKRTRIELQISQLQRLTQVVSTATKVVPVSVVEDVVGSDASTGSESDRETPLPIPIPPTPSAPSLSAIKTMLPPTPMNVTNNGVPPSSTTRPPSSTMMSPGRLVSSSQSAFTAFYPLPDLTQSLASPAPPAPPATLPRPTAVVPAVVSPAIVSPPAQSDERERPSDGGLSAVATTLFPGREGERDTAVPPPTTTATERERDRERESSDRAELRKIIRALKQQQDPFRVSGVMSAGSSGSRTSTPAAHSSVSHSGGHMSDAHITERGGESGSSSGSRNTRSPSSIIEEETEILALISLYLREKSHTTSNTSSATDEVTRGLRLKMLSRLLEEDLGSLTPIGAKGKVPGTPVESEKEVLQRLIQSLLAANYQSLPAVPPVERERPPVGRSLTPMGLGSNSVELSGNNGDNYPYNNRYDRHGRRIDRERGSSTSRGPSPSLPLTTAATASNTTAVPPTPSAGPETERERDDFRNVVLLSTPPPVTAVPNTTVVSPSTGSSKIPRRVGGSGAVGSATKSPSGGNSGSDTIVDNTNALPSNTTAVPVQEFIGVPLRTQSLSPTRRSRNNSLSLSSTTSTTLSAPNTPSSTSTRMYSNRPGSEAVRTLTARLSLMAEELDRSRVILPSSIYGERDVYGPIGVVDGVMTSSTLSSSLSHSTSLGSPDDIQRLRALSLPPNTSVPATGRERGGVRSPTGVNAERERERQMRVSARLSTPSLSKQLSAGSSGTLAVLSPSTLGPVSSSSSSASSPAIKPYSYNGGQNLPRTPGQSHTSVPRHGPHVSSTPASYALVNGSKAVGGEGLVGVSSPRGTGNTGVPPSPQTPALEEILAILKRQQDEIESLRQLKTSLHSAYNTSLPAPPDLSSLSAHSLSHSHPTNSHTLSHPQHHSHPRASDVFSAAASQSSTVGGNSSGGVRGRAMLGAAGRMRGRGRDGGTSSAANNVTAGVDVAVRGREREKVREKERESANANRSSAGRRASSLSAVEEGGGGSVERERGGKGGGSLERVDKRVPPAPSTTAKKSVKTAPLRTASTTTQGSVTRTGSVPPRERERESLGSSSEGLPFDSEGVREDVQQYEDEEVYEEEEEVDPEFEAYKQAFESAPVSAIPLGETERAVKAAEEVLAMASSTESHNTQLQDLLRVREEVRRAYRERERETIPTTSSEREGEADSETMLQCTESPETHTETNVETDNAAVAEREEVVEAEEEVERDVSAMEAMAYQSRKIAAFFDYASAHCEQRLEQQLSLSSGGTNTGTNNVHNDIELEVMVARHLPEMKKNSKSCDAYVEVVLLDFTPIPATRSVSLYPPLRTIYDLAPRGVYDQHVSDPQSLLSRLIEVDHDIVSETSTLRRESVSDGERERYDVKVVAYQRTGVQASTRYPEWRETLRLRTYRGAGISPVDVLTQPVLWFLVRDSSKVGHQLRSRDEVIAQSMLPLNCHKLYDRGTHIHTVPLLPPHPSKFRKGRAPLDHDCELKVSLSLRHQSLAQQLRLCLSDCVYFRHHAMSLLAVLRGEDALAARTRGRLQKSVKALKTLFVSGSLFEGEKDGKTHGHTEKSIPSSNREREKTNNTVSLPQSRRTSSVERDRTSTGSNGSASVTVRPFTSSTSHTTVVPATTTSRPIVSVSNKLSSSQQKTATTASPPAVVPETLGESTPTARWKSALRTTSTTPAVRGRERGRASSLDRGTAMKTPSLSASSANRRRSLSPSLGDRPLRSVSASTQSVPAFVPPRTSLVSLSVPQRERESFITPIASADNSLIHLRGDEDTLSLASGSTGNARTPLSNGNNNASAAFVRASVPAPSTVTPTGPIGSSNHRLSLATPSAVSASVDMSIFRRPGMSREREREKEQRGRERERETARRGSASKKSTWR